MAPPEYAKALEALAGVNGAEVILANSGLIFRLTGKRIVILFSFITVVAGD